jgi:SAM-dependent methyltransferase
MWSSSLVLTFAHTSDKSSHDHRPMLRRARPEDVPEITDLVIDHDPATLARLPVALDEVVARFRSLGRGDAVRICESLPTVDGIIDGDALDGLMVRVHGELQRLHEEFQHGARAAALLGPLIAALRAERGEARPRVVDVGCGTGYLVRWLAMHGVLGPVDLIGCDYNAALVGAAERAAEEESLACRFLVQNAFELEEPGEIFVSMGVLHHFRGDDLVRFFEAQQRPATLALVHYDIAPTWLTPAGAWIFHLARMREPISRHDGVLSALRAHPDHALIAAAREALPGFEVGLYAPARGPLPLLRVIRPIVAIQSSLRPTFMQALGERSRLMEWS